MKNKKANAEVFVLPIENGVVEKTYTTYRTNGTIRLISTNDPELQQFMDQCWFSKKGEWGWAGPSLPNGYGLFKGVYAHRWIFERWFGKFNTDLKILHLDNSPANVNPDNLIAGSQAANLAHASQQGRLSKPRPRLTAYEKAVIYQDLLNGDSAWDIAAQRQRNHNTIYRLKRVLETIAVSFKSLDAIKAELASVLGSKDDQEVC